MAKRTNADQVIYQINAWAARWEANVAAAVEAGAQRVEQRGKREHRWQNRSSDAEAGLQAHVQHDGQRYLLVFEHGADVPYGVYLETMQQGRFAVLLPVLRSEWPRIMAAMRRAGQQASRGGR